MTTSRHAAVWIDHHEAKIFQVGAEAFDESTVLAPQHHVHRHPDRSAKREHPSDAQHFYRDVSRALDGWEEILVVGPATAKLEFIKYVHEHEHALSPRIVGVETVDHPTDRQLVAHVREYFRAGDSGDKAASRADAAQ